MDSSYSSYNERVNVKSDKDLLSSDDIYYYSQLWDQLKEKQENEDCMSEILESINEHENLKNLLKSKKVSSILDIILPHAAPLSYLNIIRTIEEDLRIYAVDCYSSHVLETVLKCCLKHLQATRENYIIKNYDQKEDKGEEWINNFLLKSCKFIFNNSVEFITENYASHVLRTAVEVATGIEIRRQLKSKKNIDTISALWKGPMVVPKEIAKLLPGFIDKLCNLPNYPDIVSNLCGSAVLQCALTAFHTSPDHKKLLKNLVKAIINKGFSEFNDDGEIHEIFSIVPCCRLLEAILVVATNKEAKYIYDCFYKNRLHLLCVHPSGNFAVQKLCENCRDKEMFNHIYSDLSPSVEASLENGCTGILLSLVKACRRLELNQSKIINCLMSVFQCAEPISRPDSFAALLMKFVKYDDSERLTDYPFQLHGVIIVQEMLYFKKSKKIADSILNMTTANLLLVACDNKASHVINAFINSETIQHKKKKQLVDIFQGFEVDLACSNSGSRSLEVLWNFADVEEKVGMAKRLVKADKKLKNNRTGKIIYNKFHLSIFNNKVSWEKSIMGLNRKRKMKDELLKEFTDESHKKRKVEI